MQTKTMMVLGLKMNGSRVVDERLYTVVVQVLLQIISPIDLDNVSLVDAVFPRPFVWDTYVITKQVVIAQGQSPPRLGPRVKVFQLDS